MFDDKIVPSLDHPGQYGITVVDPDGKDIGSGIEARISSSNSKLDVLHADNIIIEGKIDVIHLDNLILENKVDTTNVKLDTLHSDNVTIEGKLDIIDANLTTEPVDLSGRQSFNTVFGDRLTAIKIDEISVKFDQGINANLLLSTIANGGTTTESLSRLFLQSSTAMNGLARMETRRVIRYRPGHEIYAYFTVAFPQGGVVGAQQNIGIFDSGDGFFVGFNGTNFRVCRRYNGVDNEANQTNFNIDKLDGTGASGFTLNKTNINLFRITFGYLGIAPVVFEIYTGRAKGWVPFHAIDLANTQQELSITSPNLKIRAEVIKTSGASNITMYSGSWNGGYYNGSVQTTVGDVAYSYNSDLGQSLTGTGNESVVVFRMKSTFKGKAMKAKARLIHATWATNSGDIFKVQIIANPTTIGGVATNSLTFTDIDTDSIVEYHVDGGTIVGGRAVHTDYLVGSGNGANASSGVNDVNADALGLVGYAGDTFVIAFQRVSGTGTYKALAALNWLELL